MNPFFKLEIAPSDALVKGKRGGDSCHRAAQATMRPR